MAFHKLISLLLFCLFNLPVFAKTVLSHHIMTENYSATSTPSLVNKDANRDSSTCILNEEDSTSRTSLPLSNTGKLMPCIRQQPITESLETIAAHKIAAFLAAPRVVTTYQLSTAPNVIALANKHLIATSGDQIYVQNVNSTTHQSYAIYRPGQLYKDPITHEILGHEASFIAECSLQQSGNPATFSITKANHEVLVGDKLLPRETKQLTTDYLAKAPDKNISSHIIGIHGGASQIGLYSIVVLNKGLLDGLSTGNTLAIYQQGRHVSALSSTNKTTTIKLPDELAGKLMIFRAFDRVSYAIVIKAHQAIHIFDIAQSP
jgi:hypothetical protein